MDDPTPISDTPAGATGSNVPEFSVGELSGAVRRTIEGAFGRVRVRGEITECRPYPSGHVYLSLKDDTAKLAAVIWKSKIARLGLQPENGVEVIATGRLTTHRDKSAYQLDIERLEYAGAGALLARIEALRVRLAGEGLFDPTRKRPLPLLPRVVGVITSERGAVIRDICTTIARRFPRHLLVWSVPVQGSDAAGRIAEAISQICHATPRPDVVIVARGGGSLEDLMAFNDEAVVRAAARCPIPLISAVGHETDTTLIDYAADRRAPTPTAAAEMAVPDRASLAADLGQLAARLSGAATRVTQRDRIALDRAARALPDLPALLGAAGQRLDDRAHRLDLALPNLLAAQRARLHRAERGLPDLRGMLRERLHRLEGLAGRLPAALPLLVMRRRDGLLLQSERLKAGWREALSRKATQAAMILPLLSPAVAAARLREARLRLGSAAARLESVSHRAVLARGYAAVLDARGSPVTRAAQVRPAAELAVHFTDGAVTVRAAAKRVDARQPSLL